MAIQKFFQEFFRGTLNKVPQEPCNSPKIMATSSDFVDVTELAAVRNKLGSAVTRLQKACKESISGGDELSLVSIEDEHKFWFNTTHTVTGSELNQLITEIQSVLSANLDQRKSLWKSLIEVYATIDSLDKDYLSKIEKSFEQINENYSQIKKNHDVICQNQKNIERHRVHIDELIEGHEKALNVLKKFKSEGEQRMSNLVATINGLREDCATMSNKSDNQLESLAALKYEAEGLRKRMRTCMIVASGSVILVIGLICKMLLF